MTDMPRMRKGCVRGHYSRESLIRGALPGRPVHCAAAQVPPRRRRPPPPSAAGA